MNKKYLCNIDFLKNISWYNFLLEDSCNVFNVNLFKEEFFVDHTEKYFHPGSEIKHELVKYFAENKARLLEYYEDYFTEKSIEDIAIITRAETSAVVAYIERIKNDFTTDNIKGLSKYGDVTSKTTIKNISSYKIMQHFQLMDRQVLLDEMIKTRKKAASLDIKKYL